MTSTAVRPPVVGRLLRLDPLVRRLALMSLVTTVGNGLFSTVSVLFFTRSIGLTPGRVALGLTAAGVCGVLAGVPMGRLADRVGSRRLLLVTGPLEALAVLGYAFVHSFAAFVALTCVATVLERGGAAVRSALIARAVPAETQVHTRALLRSVMNAGLVVGSAGAALALQADSRAAYVAVLVLDALTFQGAAALLAGLSVPAGAAAAARERRAVAGRRTALRDGRYLLVTGLHAVLELQLAVLTVAIPLWVVLATGAPPALVAVVNVVNCLLVVLFQVRASRGITDVPTSARACARGGLLLAAGCLLYAVAGSSSGSGSGSAALAAAAIVAGALIHSLGELLTSAGGWTLSLDLADQRAHGEYQGVFMSGQAAAHVLGPLVMSLTVVAHGSAGWLVLAALFTVSGAALPAAVRPRESAGRGAASGKDR
ncbi:MFS transporter [Kitasatospora sp. NPDC097643]|uniref:MFS transporter n=1 Tax=Kitasatospora sp. NPDC097643 TaxID=3157230 RepID=UPI003327261A